MLNCKPRTTFFTSTRPRFKINLFFGEFYLKTKHAFSRIISAGELEMYERVESMPGARELRPGRHVLVVSELHFWRRNGFEKMGASKLDYHSEL